MVKNEEKVQEILAREVTVTLTRGEVDIISDALRNLIKDTGNILKGVYDTAAFDALTRAMEEYSNLNRKICNLAMEGEYPVKSEN